MNTRALAASTVLALASVASLGQVTPPSDTASAAVPSRPSPDVVAVPAPVPAAPPASSDAQMIAALNAQISALTAQTAEMKRSEDRLLSTVHWTLGIVAAVATALAGVGVYSARTFHDRDLKRLREEVIEDLRRDQAKLFKQSELDIRNSQAESIGSARTAILYDLLDRLARLERDSSLFGPSLKTAVELFDLGQQNRVPNQILAAVVHFRDTLRQTASVSKENAIDKRVMDQVVKRISAAVIPQPDLALEVRQQIRTMYPDRQDV